MNDLDPRILALFGLSLFFLPAGSLFAWEYREHKQIGKEAYWSACNALKGGLNGEQEARWKLACGPNDFTAERYGQVNALSGDHIPTIQGFNSAAGLEKISSKIDFYKKAAFNSDHFLPEAIRKWRKNNSTAIALAYRAARADAGSRQPILFWRAFYTNGFADHFLQDSFAAGHMGFNRPASTLGESRLYHNDWNKSGRQVRNSSETWVTYGDGELEQCIAQGKCYKNLLSASTASVYRFLYVFVKKIQVPPEAMPGPTKVSTNVEAIAPRELSFERGYFPGFTCSTTDCLPDGNENGFTCSTQQCSPVPTLSCSKDICSPTGSFFSVEEVFNKAHTRTIAGAWVINSNNALTMRGLMASLKFSEGNDPESFPVRLVFMAGNVYTRLNENQVSMTGAYADIFRGKKTGDPLVFPYVGDQNLFVKYNRKIENHTGAGGAEIDITLDVAYQGLLQHDLALGFLEFNHRTMVPNIFNPLNPHKRKTLDYWYAGYKLNFDIAWMRIQFMLAGRLYANDYDLMPEYFGMFAFTIHFSSFGGKRITVGE